MILNFSYSLNLMPSVTNKITFHNFVSCLFSKAVSSSIHPTDVHKMSCVQNWCNLKFLLSLYQKKASKTLIDIWQTSTPIIVRPKSPKKIAKNKDVVK